MRLFFLLLAALVFSTSFARAELKDGDDYPAYPTDPVERRKYTITGVERAYLPTLKDGPGKGYFTYYKSRLYQAFVDENGTLSVQFLDAKGEEIGKAFQVGGSIAGHYGYTDSNRQGRSVPRVMVKTKEEYEPVKQPREKLVLEAFLEEGVEFKRTYEFKANSIVVVTGLDCPNSRKTVATMGVWFPAIMSFKPDVEQPEREAALKGYSVSFKTINDKGRKKSETFEYAQSKFYTGATDEVEVVGPWGKGRELSMKTKGPILRPYIYTGNCPYQGYHVYTHVPAGTLNKYDYKFTVEFK